MSPSSPRVADAARVALVHPGVQYAPQLAEQLDRAGLLSEFWTGVGVSDRGLLGSWLRPGATNPIARFFARRIVRGVNPGKIRLRPWHEVVAGCRLRQGRDAQELWHRRNTRFQQAVPEAVFHRNDAVIGFDTSSWILAQRSVASGRAFILDQSIGHPGAKVATFENVRRAYPQWAHELEIRRPEILEAETIEHRLAARVVAASSFTRRTLVDHGVAAGEIIVNPYGVDADVFQPATKRSPGERPLRFVFVGHVGARKGIPLLLEAWSELAPANCELWLIGHVAPRALPLVAGVRGVVLKGNVSHRDLPGLLRECDVFVFPSFFEGFAQVLLEAMACGLPVIATDATAAPDLITDGTEGFLMRAGDKGALQQHLQFFRQDRARSSQMGRAARVAAERFSWAAYGERWAALVRDLREERATAPREFSRCSPS